MFCKGKQRNTPLPRQEECKGKGRTLYEESEEEEL
jgi:hypothetical protein